MTTSIPRKIERMSALARVAFFAARLALVMLIFLLGSCDDDYTAVPVVESIDPYYLVRGQQNIQVTILGHSFLSSGTSGVSFDYGNADGISGTVVEVHDTYIILNLSVSNTAELGHHRLTVDSPHGVSVGEMIVQCNPPGSCPPEPDLTVAGVLHFSLFSGVAQVTAWIPAGETTDVLFEGKNFQGNSPMVEFDPDDPGGGLSPETVTTVDRSGNVDVFSVPIVAAGSAHYGSHRVRVRTNGGRTQWAELLVSRESTLPPPAGIPTLDSVTPSNIGAGVDTFIECHGKGFGTSPAVITTPVTPPGGTPPPTIFTITYPVVSGAADADTVAVARIWPTTASIVKVQVKNLENNQITDDIRIFVEPVKPNAPKAIATGVANVQAGGSAILHISGQNLENISDLSWSGIPGLHFSNTSATATSATVTVTADLNTPITGNQATNLNLTDGDHASYPFSFEVIP